MTPDEARETFKKIKEQDGSVLARLQKILDGPPPMSAEEAESWSRLLKSASDGVSDGYVTLPPDYESNLKP